MNYTSYCAGMGCFHPIRPGDVLSVKKKDMWDEFDGIQDDYDVEVAEDDDYDLKEDDE